MLIHNYTNDYKSLLDEYNAGHDVTIRFSFPSKDTLRTINSFIAQILSAKDRIFLLETLVTILRECIFNAVKANAKRIYFERSGTDINNGVQYENLIQKFKDEVILNFSEMQPEMEASRYSADFTLSPADGHFTIKITNNVPIHPAEQERIMQRMTNATK